jgi:hypothetical protein
LIILRNSWENNFVLELLASFDYYEDMKGMSGIPDQSYNNEYEVNHAENKAPLVVKPSKNSASLLVFLPYVLIVLFLLIAAVLYLFLH